MSGSVGWLLGWAGMAHGREIVPTTSWAGLVGFDAARAPVL